MPTMPPANDVEPADCVAVRRDNAASPRRHLTTAFSSFARRLSLAAGRPAAFCGAVTLIVLWLACGPLFGYSDTWQLIVNTATTVITFLMVFLIQHTQNRDTEEIHIKLNELIRATRGAHNTMVALEQWSDDEIDAALEQFAALAVEAERRLPKAPGGDDAEHRAGAPASPRPVNRR